MSRSTSSGQKLWYIVKGLKTKKAHIKYESPTSSHLETITIKGSSFWKVGQSLGQKS